MTARECHVCAMGGEPGVPATHDGCEHLGTDMATGRRMLGLCDECYAQGPCPLCDESGAQ